MDFEPAEMVLTDPSPAPGAKHGVKRPRSDSQHAAISLLSLGDRSKPETVTRPPPVSSYYNARMPVRTSCPSILARTAQCFSQADVLYHGTCSFFLLFELADGAYPSVMAYLCFVTPPFGCANSFTTEPFRFHVTFPCAGPGLRQLFTDAERAEQFLSHIRAYSAPHGEDFKALVTAINSPYLPESAPVTAVLKVFDARPKYVLRKLAFSMLPPSSAYVVAGWLFTP